MQTESVKDAMRKARIQRTAIWTMVGIAVGASVFGMVWAVRQAPRSTGGNLSNPVSSADWIKGDASAKVVLVEYSDFQCPACGQYFPVLKKLQDDFAGKIAFAYRHFPLKQAHIYAELAARAAEAAGRQGKFWEMHDMIFVNQSTWSAAPDARGLFVQYAGALGLDLARFTADLNDPENIKKVEGQFRSGLRSGVNGTPTFFINGKKIESPRSYDAFKSAIAAALGNS